MSTLNRRDFISMSATLGAGLLLGACAGCKRHTIFAPRSTHSTKNPTPADAPPADPNAQMLGWLLIDPDGTVTVSIPSAEMGQGVNTSLAMLVAEELDVPFDAVRAAPAPIGDQFANPKMRNQQLTGGSNSIRGFWLPMREVGAAARQMLLHAAAKQLNTSKERLTTNAGHVVHPNGTKLSYGQLASAAAQLPPPRDPPLKNPRDFKIIGKPQKRLDTPAKVRGEAVFGIDTTLKHLLHAALRQSPSLHGRLKSVEGVDKVKAMPGVVGVFSFDTWVAVVAQSWWQAKKGLDALTTHFTSHNAPTPDSAQHRADMLKALDQHGKATPNKTHRTLDVQYEAPLLEHATMSPVNCTAHVHNKGVDVWAPTQAQTKSQEVAAEAAGVSTDKVTIHTTFLGGGFGRRSETDFVRQAVLLSQKVGQPVKLIWSREETTQHGFYRAAVISRFQVGLTPKGESRTWANQIAVPNVLLQKAPAVPGFVWKVTGDVIGVDGAKKPPYATHSKDVDTLHVELNTPLGFWRAVGHSYNGFFVESVADELAALNNEDPAHFRRRHYQNHPRHRAVLDAITQMASWERPRKGRHLGMAVHESFGSVVGQVVELSVQQTNTVTLHRIWCAVDCGLVVNPDTVNAQMESGIVYGLSAATQARITLKDGVVQQSNFHDYPMMRMNQIPPIEVQIIQSADQPGGVGETSVGPIAPAVGNAIYAATGTRLRTLPFASQGFTKWRATRG